MGTEQKLPSSSKLTKHQRNESKFQGSKEHMQRILKLRSRIHKILDEQFCYIGQKLQRELHVKNYIKDQSSTKSEISINESKLQEWVEMFKNQILELKDKNNLQNQRKTYQMSQIEMPLLEFKKPCMQNQNQKILWSIDRNRLKLVSYQTQNVHNQPSKKRFSTNQGWKQTFYEFPQGFLKKYCSITHIPVLNELIIIGGSKSTNLNIKSSKVSSFNLITKQLKTLLNLPYGLSSHSAVFHKKMNSIYIIGGNKNYSIVTRGSFKVDLNEMNLEEISCLNYPVSSATCIQWKEDWIYKFGGIGDAFGEWNTSPYIERYSISQNEWEVINPSVKQGINSDSVFHNLFLANSSSYICQSQDKIFVFGGYSIEGKFKNYGFVIKIEQNKEEKDEKLNSHIIQQYGAVNIGNFNYFNNGIAITENEDRQVFLWSLCRDLDEKQTQPYLIKKFSFQTQKIQ